jgi:hypothetical protein
MPLSIIIPSYNEEVVTAETHWRLIGVLQKTGLDYEIIFLLTTVVKTVAGFLILNPNSYA